MYIQRERDVIFACYRERNILRFQWVFIIFFIVVQIRPKGPHSCKDRAVARRLFKSRHYMIKNFEKFAGWNLLWLSKKKYHYNVAFNLKYFLLFRNGRGKILWYSWQWIELTLPPPITHGRSTQALLLVLSMELSISSHTGT